MGERILRDEGYEVVSVTDGHTALVRLADVDPDVVLADVFLPGRSGVDLCRELRGRTQHRHVRLVLTAGLLENFDEGEAMAAGADAIIRKPFEASIVLETIRPLMEEARAARVSESAGEVVSQTSSEEAAPLVNEPILSTEPQAATVATKEVEIPEPVAAEAAAVAQKGAPDAVTEEERLRAAVAVALDAAFPSLVDEITTRVLNARRA